MLVRSFKPLLLAYRLAAGTQKCFVNRGQVVGYTHGDTLRVLVHFAKGEDQSTGRVVVHNGVHFSGNFMQFIEGKYACT